MTESSDDSEWVYEDIHDDPQHRWLQAALEEARAKYESREAGELPCGLCGRASTSRVECAHHFCDGCKLRCVKVHAQATGFKLIWQCPVCRSEEVVRPMTLRLWLYVAERVAVFEAADGVPMVAVLRPCEQGCYICADGDLIMLPLPM